MGAEAVTPPPVRIDARDAYLRIHKRLVGPGTAEKLSFLYRELSQEQTPRGMYEAGWAAAEAAMTGTRLEPAERHYLVAAARDCWEYAARCETERAASSAYLKNTTPDRSTELRIINALAVTPLIEGIVRGRPDKQQRGAAYDALLGAAEEAAGELLIAHRHRMGGRVGNALGVVHEVNTLLLINRLLSSRIIALPSLARADSGRDYPEQTHDVQILNLNGNVIRDIVPLEVKSRLKGKFLERYEAALLSGRQHLLIHTPETAAETAAMLCRERAGQASPDDLATLQTMTDAVIHVIRHHKRADDFGRHCADPRRCDLPQQRTA